MADVTMREETDGLNGMTRFTAETREAGLRLGCMKDVPAESVTVGNWARSGFAETLRKDGFDVEWEDEA